MLTMLICGCGGSQENSGSSPEEPMSEPVERSFFAMDTYMTVTAYGDAAAEATEAAEKEVIRLEDMLSTEKDNSEISIVNSKGEGELSEETGELVARSLDLYEKTGHRFDIAIYPVIKAWGFTNKDYRVPTDEELEDLLPLTDADDIIYDKKSRKIDFKKDGMAIDLGGIAKGYASSQIMKIFEEKGISSGLVSLGGNVQTLGKKPDGSRWRVAVQDPDVPMDGEAENVEQRYLGVLDVENIAVITSGAYERNFTKDGVLYHHIIDPATGKPADSGLRSVTIVCSDGTLADALSTSLYIMGKEEAIKYWRDHEDQFDFILMDEDNRLFVSQPIASRFVSDSYQVTVIE